MSERDETVVWCVVGARPNFMKMAPVLEGLRRRPALRPYLVHTGQHYDPELSRVFFEELGLPRPDRELGVGSGSHARQTAAVMCALDDLWDSEPADLVVVAGDVNSTLAAGPSACALRSAPSFLGRRKYLRSIFSTTGSKQRKSWARSRSTLRKSMRSTVSAWVGLKYCYPG